MRQQNKVLYKQQCPSCLDSGRDNLAVYSDGSSYCFGCGYYESTGTYVEEDMNVSKKEENKLENLVAPGNFQDLPNRGITKQTCEKWGYHVSKYSGSVHGEFVKDIPVAVANYYDRKGKIISQKIRTKDKKFKYVGQTTDLPLFGEWLCDNNPNRFVIVTEGLEKAMAVSQVFNHDCNVVSLNNGAAPNGKEFKEHYEFLNQFKHVVVLLDMDDAGHKAAEAAVDIFPPGKVKIATISEKDPDTMLIKGKAEELKKAIWKAEVVRPEGVIDLADLDIDIFEDKFEKGVDTGYPQLDHYLGGLRKGELTMVTAGTGIGKTTWCTQLAYDLMTKRNMKVADIKLEKNAKATLFDYCAMYYDKHPRTFRQDPTLLSDEKKRQFLNDFSNKLYLYKHFGSMDQEPLIKLLEHYAVIEEVDFIIFDHISIAVSGLSSSREGERKDIDKLTTKLRELIDRTGVGIICVSHLKNPPTGTTQWEEGRAVRRCDLRGSGSLAQLADNIIGIEGNLLNDDTKKIRKIKLIKAREGDEQEVYCDQYTYDNKTHKLTVWKDILE